MYRRIARWEVALEGSETTSLTESLEKAVSSFRNYICSHLSLSLVVVKLEGSLETKK